MKKIIKVKRSQIKEVYHNGVLVGYVETKSDGEFRELLVSAHYEIQILENE